MGFRYLFRACFHNANRKALCTSASMFYQLSQSTKDLCEPILAFDLCVTFTERFASDQAIAGSFGASLETANISIAQQTGHVKRNLWVETK